MPRTQRRTSSQPASQPSQPRAGRLSLRCECCAVRCSRRYLQACHLVALNPSTARQPASTHSRGSGPAWPGLPPYDTRSFPMSAVFQSSVSPIRLPPLSYSIPQSVSHNHRRLSRSPVMPLLHVRSVLHLVIISSPPPLERSTKTAIHLTVSWGSLYEHASSAYMQ